VGYYVIGGLLLPCAGTLQPGCVCTSIADHAPKYIAI